MCSTYIENESACVVLLLQNIIHMLEKETPAKNYSMLETEIPTMEDLLT